MSRFKAFLSEDSGLTFDDIVRDCQPWIKYCRETKVRSGIHTIYRGMKGKPEFEILKLSVRKDRIPSDTPVSISEYIDSLLFNMFKWKPRSQSLFAIRDFPDEVAYYGTPYAIYPIGEVKTVFSSYVNDFTYDLAEKLTNAVGKSVQPSDLKSWWSHAPEDKRRLLHQLAQELFNEARYTENAPLQQAGPSTELMIGCNEYYAVPKPYIIKHFQEMKEKGIIGEL